MRGRITRRKTTVATGESRDKVAMVPRCEALMRLLKRYRLAQGMTRQSLASKLGVHQSTVATWETGRSIPRDEIFPKLANQLGVDPLELTRIISPEPAPRPAPAASVR